jgi:hypothetical protein
VSGVGERGAHGYAAGVMEAARRMEGFGAPWCVAGGWAVDLFLGRHTRPHADVDLAILRGDQQRLHAHFAGWRIQRVMKGEFADWPAGEWLHPPVHEIHARAPDGATFEFLLNDHDASEWIFRRNPAVRCPLRELILPSDAGTPILCPAVVLLYKAKAPRLADEHDFQQLRAVLPGSQRRWLREGLARVHPGHPWIAQLPPSAE